MYRVRKLNRRNLVPDARAQGRRARLQDFQQAVKRLHRRRRSYSAAEIQEAREWNRIAGAPRGAIGHVAELVTGKSFGIVAPLSTSGFTPSLAEALRVVTAIRLARTLAERAVAPCVVVLWAGIPGAMDGAPRLVLDRNGNGSMVDAPPASATMAEQVESAITGLPPNDFLPWVKQMLTETWHPDPTAWKLRQVFHVLAKRRAVALPAISGPRAPGRSWDAIHRGAYRVALARMLETWPVVALVHPAHGDTVSVDVAAGTAFSGEVVPFPTVTATVVETKVERWLDRYGVRPEDLMDSRMQVSRLVNQLMPADALGAVKTAREAMLSRLFRLEHVMRECGFQADKTLDKLAAQLDQQFDHLKLDVVRAERETREHALSQLSKSRSYLRPGGAIQAESMSLLHFLGFYGPQFIDRLVESVEIGDGRHHLVYLGTGEAA